MYTRKRIKHRVRYQKTVYWKAGIEKLINNTPQPRPQHKTGLEAPANTSESAKNKRYGKTSDMHQC